MKELQPPQETDDRTSKGRLCLEDGEFSVFVNEPALAELRWSLWSLASQAVRGEDVSLPSGWKGPLRDEGTPIGYCEITLAGEGRSHNPKCDHLLRLEDNRLDLFVTREPAKDAFFLVRELDFSLPARRAQIFGLLWIVPLTDALWPAEPG